MVLFHFLKAEYKNCFFVPTQETKTIEIILNSIYAHTEQIYWYWKKNDFDLYSKNCIKFSASAFKWMYTHIEI